MHLGGLQAVAALLLGVSAGAGAVLSASPLSLNRDGTLQIAGRNLRCGGVRTILDPHLPNLGLAAPGVLVINPGLLKRRATTVGLFVFHHECGHHQVGESELGADCWAVNRGVRDGWLDSAGLKEVCGSFEGAPETDTHPSAVRRCKNLDRCFATTVAAMSKRAPGSESRTAVTSWSSGSTPPKLLTGPTLVRLGYLRAGRN